MWICAFVCADTLAAASLSTRQEELNMRFTKPNIYVVKLQADSSTECSLWYIETKEKTVAETPQKDTVLVLTHVNPLLHLLTPGH